MRLQANGIAIEVDDVGPPSAPAVLLIMGLGMQLTAWPDALVQRLLRRGFRVVRFDNRDIGLSQHFDHLGVPSVPWSMVRYTVGLPVRAPYRIADMAQDALGVLDALGISRAHVCGASMGGMIAQHLAARHPQRVLGLTLAMTTTGRRRLPPPQPAVQRMLVRRTPSGDRRAAAEHAQRLLTMIASPGYPTPPAELRARIEQAMDRSWHPAGATRQLLAIAADGDRSPMLSRITAPTTILHGQDDPLVRVQAAHDLRRRIAHAELDLVPGMGHDFPDALMPRFADAIAQTADRVPG